MLRSLTAATLLTTLVAATNANGTIQYSREALQDEIDSLPGAPAVGFRMFSGYVDVTPPGAAPGSRQMFYWFVESQNTPATDPLFLWTNGGPGCSGLGGFMTEQGPFRPNVNGTSLSFNPYSWNKVANMVFIEQPVGVGFSTAEGSIDYGDDQASQDNAQFVQGFFQKFTALTSNPFYISSESYGGHYMPTLAQRLVLAKTPNFKGVFLGNPLTWMPYRNYGQYGTAYGHQLLPKPLWDQYEAANCKDTWPTPTACGPITDQFDQILSGFDGYALDFPVCTDNALAQGRAERHALVRAMKRGGNGVAGYFPDNYQPCASDWGGDYLNRADVQQAIHVAQPGKQRWSMCADIGYNQTDVNQPMMPIWKWLVANSDLKMMIYSGDDDSVCATLGTQQFIWDLGLTPTTKTNWQPWSSDHEQVSGFVTEFETGGSSQLALATVHGAGHMVPQTRPAQALALLTFGFLGASVDDLTDQ